MSSMVTGAETAELLARVPLFADLSRDELQRLAAVAVPRNYADGEVIFREGDTGATCFIIRTGSARVTRSHRDGRAITLAELRPGDIFGDLAMFGGEKRSATVEACEDSTAVALLASDLRSLLRSDSDIAFKMLSAMADRVRTGNDRISQRSFQGVAGRVAGTLLNRVEARRAEGEVEGDIEVHATQSEIAQLAGSSRESASRFLATLEREGVVTCGRGKVVVHDPETLRNYIH